MRSFFLMALTQWLQYVVLTINFRAIAHEQYWFAGATAMVATYLSYTIVRRIVKDESRWGLAGMMFGGALGDMTGIYITRAWG